MHLDLDVLDPGVGRANPYAEPGGLDAEELLGFLDRVREAGPVTAAALTAYAPEVDDGGRAAAAAEVAIERVLGLS